VRGCRRRIIRRLGVSDTHVGVSHTRVGVCVAGVEVAGGEEPAVAKPYPENLLNQVLEWLEEENLRSYAPLFVHHDLDSLEYVTPQP